MYIPRLGHACMRHKPSHVNMDKSTVDKFYAHLCRTAEEAIKRMQDKRPPIHNMTLFVNGETLEIPFNADTFDALEAFLMDLRLIE